MTELLFRDDAYLKVATATVVRIHAVAQPPKTALFGGGTEPGLRAASPAPVQTMGVELDRTLFYPLGGGQPGDTGFFTRASGERIPVTDTRKGPIPDSVLHTVSAPLEVGETVGLEIDWARRYALMRLHTALHVMSCVV